MKNILRMFVVSALAIGAAIASDLKEMALPDVRIDAAGGHFLLSKLHVKRGGPLKLTGVMTNKTGKQWNTIELKVVPNLSLTSNPPVTKYIVKPDEEFPFYWQLPGKHSLENLSFTFTADGSYASKYAFRLVKPVESDDLRLADSNIELILAPFEKGVGFQITNKSDTVLKLVWNDAAMVDCTGKTMRVMGSGVRYLTRNEARPNASILPGAFLKDQYVPIDNVTNVAGPIGWMTEDLFPDCPKCTGLLGAEFKVYFPFLLGEKTLDYSLAVKIISVE